MHYAAWDPEAVLRQQNMSFHNTRIFALAFWKTINIQKSYKLIYLRKMLIALILFPFASLYRGCFPPQVQDKVVFDAVEIDNLNVTYNEQIKRNITSLPKKIYFSPPWEPFENIIKLTCEKLQLDGYKAVEDVVTAMASKEYLFAVCFNGNTKGKLTELPAVLDYELRFPPTLRSSKNIYSPFIWEIDTYFVKDDPVDNDAYTGVPPGYMEEGFIQLQHAIAMSYIELKSKAKLPHIKMNKFPASRLIEDPYRVQIKILLSLAILFAYIFPSYATVQAITDEEERGIMTMLNIKIKNWCAWILILFILQTLTTIFILIAVELSWARYTLFTYTQSWPVFCFLLCYVCASSSFILTISIVFIQSRKNAKYALTMRIFNLMPLPFLLSLDWGLGWKLLGCLSLDTALAMGISIIIDFEANGQTVKWENFLYPHFAGDNFSLIHATVMLLLDSVLYTLILLYHHYKYPPEITIVPTIDKKAMGRKWYYPVEFLICYKYRKNLFKDIGMFLLNHLTVHENDLVDNEPSFRPSELNDKGTQTDPKQGRNSKGTMPLKRISSRTSSRGSSETSLIVAREKKLRKHTRSEIIPESSESSLSSAAPSRILVYRNNSWVTIGGETNAPRSFSERSYFSEQSYEYYVNPPLINDKQGIQVNMICKKIGYVEYLDNITMNIHPKEITVILSKETESRLFLSHIIAGTVSPTSGNVLINNEDVATYKGKETLCYVLPPESIIFTQLTTTENMYFYMHLKGMRNYRQICREIEKYLDLLGMSIDEAEELADELSLGKARCLSLCCALCGGKHAVIVDNPTEGLNQTSRYHMWDLLKTAARTRVIIVNTIYCDEAEILGTRIAVLHNGRLQCFDYAKSLRDMYCNTYTLHCEIINISKADENYTEFYSLLLKYFPIGAVAKYLPNQNKFEVVFSIENEPMLVQYLVQVEEQRENYGFGKIWVRRNTLRDVFITQEAYFKMPNWDTMDAFISEAFNKPDGEEKLSEDFGQQFKAFLMAKIILLKRLFWVVTIVALMIPFCVLLNLQTSDFKDLDRLNISFASYVHTRVLIRENLKLDSTMLNHAISKSYIKYNQYIQQKFNTYEHRFTIVAGRREIKEYFLYLDVLSILAVKSFYLAAADFHPDDIIVYWNNRVKHSSPLALNMLHNTLARHFIGPNTEINVANHPLPYGNMTILNVMEIHPGMYIGIGYGVILVMSIIVSLMGLPLMADRISGNMNLQLLSRKTAIVYWVSYIAIDAIIYLIIVLYLTILLVIHDLLFNYERPNYDDPQLVLFIAIVLMLYGIAALPFVYFFTNLFETLALGFACTLSVLVCSSIGVMMTFGLTAGLSSQIFRRLCFWSPTLVLFKAMRKIHITAAIRRACNVVQGCKYQKSCCNLKSYYHFDYPGIINEILLFLCQGTVYLTIVIYLYKNPLFFKNLSITKPKPLRTIRTSSNNENIIREKNYVRDLHGPNLRMMSLVVKGVRNHTNLREIWFYVQPGQVCGILGPDNSGKSTLLRCIIGENRIEFGKVYVAGVNVRRYLMESKHYITSCPPTITVMAFMTVREILNFYCLLGKRKPALIPNIVDKISKFLELDTYLDTRVDKLSYSDMRMITLLLSFFSHKNILVLDSPTKGMEPKDKAKIWLLIEILKLNGRTIILTTNDIDEAIFLCDKVGIMSKGYLKNIGSVTNLVSQNSLGYTVEILRSRVVYSKHPLSRKFNESYIKVIGANYFDDGTSDSQEYTLENSTSELSFKGDTYFNREWAIRASKYRNIVYFMMDELPFAVLQESYNNILVYLIPFDMMTLSEVYKAMHAAQKVLDVHSYKVTRKSLEENYDEKSRQEG